MRTPRRGPQGVPRLPASVDWRAVGLRKTPQREVVLGLVRSCFDHPTAEWIHQQARLLIPEISLATVYRTLRILKEKGLIHEFSGGASPSRFDGTVHDHEHVRCVRCGAVADVELPEVGDIREKVTERTGFRVGSYPLVFHGLCVMCARANGSARTAENGTASESEEADDGESSLGDDRHLAEGYW